VQTPLEASGQTLKGDRTQAESAQQLDVHPSQITQWKAQLQERATEVFAGKAPAAGPSVDVKALLAKIGELTRGRTIAISGALVSTERVSECRTEARRELAVSPGSVLPPNARKPM
jgi:transposase